MKVMYDPILGKLRVKDSEGSLPTATQPGTTIAYNGAEWESRYGEKHVTVTGDFLGENGYLYVLNLENDMTVRIGAVDSLEDYAFDLLVFQGATVRQLTLLGDHHPIWWAAGDWYPQSYSSENMPPAMGDENTGYLVHFTWSSDARVLLAEVSKTFDATRGVIVDSAGVFVTSAMTYTGGTIGVGEVANHVTVYNRGVATGQTVVSGGYVSVSGGGIASNTNLAHANGQLQVFVGGIAVAPTVDSGTLSVERGTVDGITANGGSVNATSNAIISGGTITQSGNVTVTESEIAGVGVGGTLTVSSGGVATSSVVTSGGLVKVSSGGVASNCNFDQPSSMFVYSGGVASGGVFRRDSARLTLFGGRADGIAISGGRIVMEDGGSIAENCTLNGFNVIHGGTATNCLQTGGTLTANRASAVVVSHTISGGTLVLASGGIVSEATVYSPGKLTVSSGGIASDTTVSSGGNLNVSSGGIASHFSSVDGATVEVLSGGSATTNGTAYGVSVEEGGALTVESGGVLHIQSGKTAYGVTVSSGGTVNILNGGEARETTAYQATINVSNGGIASGITASGLGLNVSNGGLVENVTAQGASYLLVSNGGTITDTNVYGSATVFGSANNLTISGILNVRSPGKVTNLTKHYRSAYISAGASVENALVESGALVEVLAGGLMSAPTITNTGSMTVSSGGSALDVVKEPDAVIDSQTGATVTYAKPIAGSQGVFTSSGTTPVASAMVVSGGTIGNGLTEKVMNVYGRGRALGVTLDSGGSAFVYSSGIMSGCSVMQNAQLVVFNGGVAEALTVSGSLAAVASSGGIVRGCSVLNGSIFSVRIGAVASSVIVSAYGAVSTEGELVGASLVGVNARIQTRGGVVRDAVISSGAYINVSAGVNSNTTILNGGSMTVSSGGSADITDVKSGGLLIVSSGGLALNVTAENQNDVVVIEGGTVDWKA